MPYYCTVIPPVDGAPHYLVQAIWPSGRMARADGFLELDAAKAFMAKEYPGAIELTPGEFLSMTARRELAVSR